MVTLINTSGKNGVRMVLIFARKPCPLYNKRFMAAYIILLPVIQFIRLIQETDTYEIQENHPVERDHHFINCRVF